MDHWSRTPILFLLVSFLASFLVRPFSFNADAILGEHEGLRILLLTAHPDDECMFFAPTILTLAGIESTIPKEQRPELYSLCLSVGDADGLGDTRRDELWKSLEVLGIPDGRRWIVDDPDLQDNFTATWDTQVIANTVKPFVDEHQINVILTFDEQGISSHPNHISLLHGVAHLIGSIPAAEPRPRLFSLISVPLHTKYIGLLAPFISKAQTIAPADHGPAFISGLGQYMTALRAMTQHRSQLVWFRWLYVSFSRYMWVNEWVEVFPSATEARTSV